MSQELIQLSEQYTTAAASTTRTEEDGSVCSFMTTFGLRLAAQETKERFDKYL